MKQPYAHKKSSKTSPFYNSLFGCKKDMPNVTDAADVEGSDFSEADDFDIFDDFNSFQIIATTSLVEIAETEDHLPVALIPKELLPKINARSDARTYQLLMLKQKHILQT
jgi:hypothetical protein